MRRILVCAYFETRYQWADFLSRFLFHFRFHQDITLVVFGEEAIFSDVASLPIPESLRPPSLIKTIKACNVHIETICWDTVGNLPCSEIEGCEIGLVYQEWFYVKNKSLMDGKVRRRFHLCDPVETRQEGGNFIQAALDFIKPEVSKGYEEGSCQKFIRFAHQVSTKNFKKATVFATGPSIEDFKKYDYTGSLNIYCNSTILNSGLLTVAPPLVLTFADPIFHFGASDYAETFRASCIAFMRANSDCVILIPMKYYALAMALFSDFKQRIIGIPFTKNKPINFEITRDNFYTYTTANILTLSLLPVATTFSKNVRLIGCDGREVTDDGYFWGHGNSVQLNDKMKIIQRAHPGFFDIDYNEYYFEHCHNLSRMLMMAESQGWQFSHLGDSFIPALAARPAEEVTVQPIKEDDKKLFIFVDEPPNHRTSSADHRLVQSFSSALSGRGIDTAPPRSITSSTASNHSPVQAFSGMKLTDCLQKCSGDIEDTMIACVDESDRFREGLKAEIAIACAELSYEKVILFIQEGSMAHLAAALHVKSELSPKVSIDIVCVLAFEVANFEENSVFLNGERNGAFRRALLEAAYHYPSVKVYGTNEKFNEHIFKKYDIALAVLPPLSLACAEPASEELKAVETDLFKNPEILIHAKFSDRKRGDDFADELTDMLKRTNITLSILQSLEESDPFDKIRDCFPGRVKLVSAQGSELTIGSLMAEADIVLFAEESGEPSEELVQRFESAVSVGTPMVGAGRSYVSDQIVAKKLGLVTFSPSADALLAALERIFTKYLLFSTTEPRSSVDVLLACNVESQLDQILSSSEELVYES